MNESLMGIDELLLLRPFEEMTRGCCCIVLKLGEIKSETDDDLDEEDAEETDAEDKDDALVFFIVSDIWIMGLLVWLFLLLLFDLHIAFI